MQLEDWLDDLCVRFIINLPPEELASVERICFQVEEAQWFYEDFIRPLDPALPSLNLKQFSLRIFQHCPLFSQWSAQHHTTAFAEFLAYKQRVPVRGAILLNHDMDEVILVKGWKKGANWSFPRGKINKDENDLDCAVREVYEETGFDARAAGLVKAEKDMKYIEVTMREQHMRLYVFPDVPKDTYFEPRTRKEISKIEWYKLSDLPTQKKKHHHEGNEESLAINANKFYMVAPFLHPLKKWIAQQKKGGKRHSSNLAAPPIYAEEATSETETLYNNAPLRADDISPNVPSSLPEVAAFSQQTQLQDPSTHLKELLKIGGAIPEIQPTEDTARSAPGDATQKSDALLALLRNGSGSQARNGMPQQADQSEITQPTVVNHQMPHGGIFAPHHNVPQPPTLPPAQQNLLSLFSKSAAPTVKESAPPPVSSFKPSMDYDRSYATAPYQRTGDPQFARNSPEESRSDVVPPADNLPKLTHHTRALLDAFKTGPPPRTDKINRDPIPQPQTPAPQQTLLDMFKTPASNYGLASNIVPKSVNAAELSNLSPAITRTADVQISAPEKPVDLLDLFKKANKISTAGEASSSSSGQPAPVELSATPARTQEPQSALTQNEKLAALFTKDKTDQPKKQRNSTSEAGQTGATVDAPLVQPQFEGVSLPTSAAKSLQRSPLSTHRTLYDPKQPTPVKILSRPESRPSQAPRSPRPPKAHINLSSPKRNNATKDRPFQPQILRRPQAPDTNSAATLTPNPTPSEPKPTKSLLSLPIPSPSPTSVQSLVTSPTELLKPRHQRPDHHKQNLLSLFSNASLPTSTAPPPNARKDSTHTLSGLAPPLSTSQIISPTDDRPISTRSRMGSLTSVTSAMTTTGMAAGPQSFGGLEGRPKVEKRQTNAEDKAFLLNYLGKIASRDG